MISPQRHQDTKIHKEISLSPGALRQGLKITLCLFVFFVSLW
jgi:hypothetical protein